MAEKMKCDILFLGFYEGRVFEGGSKASLEFLDKHGVYKEAFGAHFREGTCTCVRITVVGVVYSTVACFISETVA